MEASEPSDWIRVACDLCGENDSSHIARGDRFGIVTTIVMCPSCGFVYQNPRLSEQKLIDFYERHYRRIFSGSNEEPPQELLDEEMDRGRRILDECREQLPPGGLVVDVGCGPGATLIPFRDAGFAVLGAEPGPYGEWGRTYLGLDIRRQLESTNVVADLIILTYVLEHVQAPQEHLGKTRRLLTEQGILYVEVPDLMQAWLPMGSYFHVAHVSYFTAATLQTILLRTGFAPTAVTADGRYALKAVARRATEVPNAWPAQSPAEVSQFLRRYRARSGLRSLRDRLKFLLGRGSEPRRQNSLATYRGENDS